MAEVVKAAGFLHGAFNAHFDSKEKLQAAAVARPGLVPRSRLVGSDLRAWHRSWTDHGQLGSNPVIRAEGPSARTKWEWKILPWMVARNERSSRVASWQSAGFGPGFLIFVPKA